jgi:hypothetical protein
MANSFKFSSHTKSPLGDLGVKYFEVNQLHYYYPFFQYFAQKYTNLKNKVLKG